MSKEYGAENLISQTHRTSVIDKQDELAIEGTKVLNYSQKAKPMSKPTTVANSSGNSFLQPD